MVILIMKKEIDNQRNNSTVASFKVEGINLSKDSIDYMIKRQKNQISCASQIETLKRKYSSIERQHNVFKI